MNTRPPDILLIDDDDWVAVLVERTLQRDGYECVRVSDGIEGLRRLAQPPPPRLVLLDVMMPLINGFAVLAEMRKQELTRELPVLMLTSLSAKKDVMRAIQDGATDYLSKPFSTSELSARVRRMLGEPEKETPTG